MSSEPNLRITVSKGDHSASHTHIVSFVTYNVILPKYVNIV